MRSMSRKRVSVGRRARVGLVLVIALGLAALGDLGRPLPVAAQDIPGVPPPESEPEVDLLAAEQISSRLDAVEKEILAAEQAASSREDSDAAEAPPRLRAIANLLKQQKALVSEGETTRRASGPAADENEPISVFSLNNLYEQMYEAEEGARSRAQELTARRAALDEAKQIFEQRERERRESRAALENADDPQARAAASRTLHERELESRIAQETVHLRTLETRRAQRATQISEEEMPDFSAQAEAMRDALAAGRGDSSDGMAALDRREGELRRRRESLERDLTPIELRLAAAQRRFSGESRPSDRLLGEIETLDIRRDALHQQIAIVDSQIQRLGAKREAFTRWEDTLDTRDHRDPKEEWTVETERHEQDLDTAGIQKQGRIEDLRARLDRLGERLAQLEETDPNRSLLEEQRTALADLVMAHGADARALATERRLLNRVLADLRGEGGFLGPLVYAKRVWTAVRETWNFEVTAVDDSRSPMSIRSVQSRVRFGIGDLFQEHGLVIAFPQRDVHLDSSAPIEVRVVDGNGLEKTAP